MITIRADFDIASAGYDVTDGICQHPSNGGPDAGIIAPGVLISVPRTRRTGSNPNGNSEGFSPVTSFPLSFSRPLDSAPVQSWNLLNAHLI